MPTALEKNLLRHNATETGIYIAVEPPSGQKVHVAAVGTDHALCGSKLSTQAELFRVDEHRVQLKRVCKACLKKEI